MKTLDEFRQFFDTDLQPTLVQLDQKRKSIRKFILLIILGAVLLIGGVIVVIAAPQIAGSKTPEDLQPIYGAGGVVGLIGLIIVIVYAVKYNKANKRFVRKFKNTIVDPIVKFVNPSLEYNMDSFIPQSEFSKSRIFEPGDKEAQRRNWFSSGSKSVYYKGEDHVKGMIGATDVQFSELNYYYEIKRRDSDGKTKTEKKTIFKGVFFIADFHKNFTKDVVVLPDTSERMFGSLGKMFQKMNFQRDKVVRLEDPRFEKEFVVYSNDEVESRYILTPAMMERMTEYKKKVGQKMYFSFVDSRLFMAIRYRKDLFEPTIMKSINDFALVQEFFENMKVFVEMVEDLDLNTRIWTKE